MSGDSVSIALVVISVLCFGAAVALIIKKAIDAAKGSGF